MTPDDDKPRWWIFGGDGSPEQRLARLPEPPPWRRFDAEARAARGKRFLPSPEEIDLVNAALYLRRPLLITGKPGVGKTSLTYAVAEDLGLGEVLRWSITTSTVLKDGLYRYDAIARLQDASLRQAETSSGSKETPAPNAVELSYEASYRHRRKPLTPTLSPRGRGRQALKSTTLTPAPPPIGHYLRLGPLGTAFATSRKNRPRVLLVDEIDKSDLDLPNNLLHIFEEGEFSIPELERLPEDTVRILPSDAPRGADPETHGIEITRGRVPCAAFPLVILTSNAEREFPPAFLRRCLKLDMAVPGFDALKDIVRLHLFGPQQPEQPALAGKLEERIDGLIRRFLQRRDERSEELAADQLLNAVYLVLREADPEQRYGDRKALMESLWRPLSE